MYKSVFSLLLAITVVTAKYPHMPCETGETSANECNRCFCINPEVGWACTLMLCPAESKIETTENKVCEPGTRRENDGCLCNPDGSDYVCPVAKRSIEEDTCKPGETFKRDCNTCNCPPNGLRSLSACTLMLCPVESKIESTEKKVCEPGTRRENDGCYCSPDGSDYKCPVEKRSIEEDTCKPGETFMRDCNTCNCPPNGLRSLSACTLMLCPVESKIESTEKKVCEPGTRRENDGCYCSPDGSDYKCPVEKRSIEEDTCKPGETFKRDCNTCHCPPNGLRSLSACTLMACPKDSQISKDSLVLDEQDSGASDTVQDYIVRAKRSQILNIADGTVTTCEPGEVTRTYCPKCTWCSSCVCVQPENGDSPDWKCSFISCN